LGEILKVDLIFLFQDSKNIRGFQEVTGGTWLVESDL